MIDTPTAEFSPDWVSHPGETISDLLEEKRWSQTELAERMGFTRKHVNELISGKSALTPAAALRLESALGGSATFWLAREARYREACLRRQAEDALVPQAGWLQELPLKDMVRYGWTPRVANVGGQVAACLQFFGVATVDAWRQMYAKPLAVFRAATKLEKWVGSVAAWLRQGEREASGIRCAPFDQSAFRASLADIRELTREPDPTVFVGRLVATCARCGVATVFVPAPKGCPASGATRWLSADRVILQLSLRYKTNDQLWFTFFHEAAHLILHGRQMFLEGAGTIDERHEDEANRFAADELIPRDLAERLSSLPKSAIAIQTFANEAGVAPGIVVGRMQREGLLPWTHLNGLKIQYRWELDKR